MKAFSIDFKRMAILLLPTMLRKLRFIAFLRAIADELQSIHTQTIPKGFRRENLYRLEHNGQVCYLRKALNDAFSRDRLNGFEIIDNTEFGEWLITYNENNSFSGSIPKLSDNSYIMIYDKDYIERGAGDFMVLYPEELEENEDKKTLMRALVNTYRLASRIPIYRVKIKK